MKLRITKRRKYHSANVTLRGNENDMSMIITAARDGMRKLAERAGPTGEYAAELLVQLDRADELLDERDSYVYGVEEEL